MNNKLELTPARASILLEAINREIQFTRYFSKPGLEGFQIMRIKNIELEFMKKFIEQYLEEIDAKS